MINLWLVVKTESVCRQIALIHDLQLELNDMGAVVKVLPHLARPCDNIAKEVLAFICLSLFNANDDVQVYSQVFVFTLII